MSDPREIYLQPWCRDCEQNQRALRREPHYGREWCTSDEWGRCEECGRTAARYVLEDPSV